LATDAHDFVARVDLTDLAADQTVFVRATFEDSAGRARSAALEGRFRTAPFSRRNIRFLWSGDTARQGFGINPEWGGMRTYEAMRRTQPDFFVHCGDTIYADGPITAAMPLADGGVWRNIDGGTSELVVTLKDLEGRSLFVQPLEPIPLSSCSDAPVYKSAAPPITV
jgi:alkaline phosphatase D